MLNSLKENWFFIKQDLISYSMSTGLYVLLCLIRNFSIQSAIYGFFECLVFYLPFWYIRIQFCKTYHSDSWEHCKKCTRFMLCTGVFVMWLLPIKYTLFNALFVAVGCCVILYFVEIEVEKKRELRKTIQQSKDPKQDIITMCRKQHISERDTKVAIMYYVDGMKPKQIWKWLCSNNENMEYDSVYKLLNRLRKKLK